MNANRKLLLTLLAVATIGIIGFAGDERRQPTSTRTSEDVQRTETQVGAELGIGAQMTPQLPDEQTALRQQYMGQIQALEGQLAVASEDAQAAIQDQVMALKLSFKVARLNLALEQARREGNSEAETRILSALNNLTNRAPHERHSNPRDPQTGLPLEGGAR